MANKYPPMMTEIVYVKDIGAASSFKDDKGSLHIRIRPDNFSEGMQFTWGAKRVIVNSVDTDEWGHALVTLAGAGS